MKLFRISKYFLSPDSYGIDFMKNLEDSDRVYQLNIDESEEFDIDEHSELKDKNCDLAFLEKYFVKNDTVNHFDRELPKKDEVWKHFKGKTVKIIGIAKNSENANQQFVIYDCGENGVYARPLEMFMSEVNKEKYPNVEQKYRFELMEKAMADKTIKIKYFDGKIEKVEKISKGDWIDLRAAETVDLKKGDFKYIRLGVGMVLPTGFEAWVLPRSSTPKKFGIVMANSMGVIDNSYSGDKDEWCFPALAIRDTHIEKGERICQFRIEKNQPSIAFEEVEHLNDVSRGGLGSTGKR